MASNNISLFGFVFKKNGGLIGANDKISYNSFTKKLIHLGRNIEKEKEISQQDEDTLKTLFSDNAFFEVKNFYPKTGEINDGFGIRSLLHWMVKFKRPIGLMIHIINLKDLLKLFPR